MAELCQGLGIKEGVFFLSRCLAKGFKVHSSGGVVGIDPLRLVVVLQEPGWVFRLGVPHRAGAVTERCPCGWHLQWGRPGPCRAQGSALPVLM